MAVTCTAVITPVLRKTEKNIKSTKKLEAASKKTENRRYRITDEVYFPKLYSLAYFFSF